jgi:hypothetical protein
MSEWWSSAESSLFPCLLSTPYTSSSPVGTRVCDQNPTRRQHTPQSLEFHAAQKMRRTTAALSLQGHRRALGGCRGGGFVRRLATSLSPSGSFFTPEQKAQFQDDGFLVVDRLIDPSLAEAIKNRFPLLFRCPLPPATFRLFIYLFIYFT